MSPLKYQCLKCHVCWGDLTAGEDNVSHGFCKRCLREMMKEKIWKRQKKEGFQDCYARGYEDCSENGCAFYGSCLEQVIKEWEHQEGIQYAKAVGQGKR